MAGKYYSKWIIYSHFFECWKTVLLKKNTYESEGKNVKLWKIEKWKYFYWNSELLCNNYFYCESFNGVSVGRYEMFWVFFCCFNSLHCPNGCIADGRTRTVYSVRSVFGRWWFITETPKFITFYRVSPSTCGRAMRGRSTRHNIMLLFLVFCFHYVLFHLIP